MTQDEIIEMARQAGFNYERHTGIDGSNRLEAFAKLVAEKALAQEKALQALHDENERLGLYRDAYAEPVAYLVLFEGAGKLLEFTKGNYLHGAKVEHIPLYTAPPQRTEPVIDKSAAIRIATALGWEPKREWVGLTAEEVLQCWEKAHEPGNEGLINAIRMADEVENKLKEKA